jgi:hypothetical protein
VHDNVHVYVDVFVDVNVLVDVDGLSDSEIFCHKNYRRDPMSNLLFDNLSAIAGEAIKLLMLIITGVVLRLVYR